jgi:hypothetical protein
MSKVNIDKLAKDFLGIKHSIDMETDDERYFNPQYRDYQNFVNGANQAIRTNAGGISLEDVKHLYFIYERLIHLHSVNENTDYMIKFKSIIESLTK